MGLENLDMGITMLKSKIHRATITQCDLNYIGSITLDPVLIEAAGLYEYEKVHVVNINNGSRFETYVIEGEKDSGEVCLNGAAARLGMIGDKVIIIAYAQINVSRLKELKQKIVVVNDKNQVIQTEKQKKSIRSFDELYIATE
jgi:aspartate 1-decarboxylase